MSANRGAAVNVNGGFESRIRVLVIEDEPHTRMFLARGLAAEGMLVDERVDGRSGLLRALEGKYDLVIIDLVLPELDGLSVLQALHDNRPSLPVMILSPHPDLRTKLRGFELGADDYLQKPFALEELLARIRVHLRRRALTENGHGTVVRAAGVVLDLATRRATFGQTVAELSSREFQLLLKLIEHAGEVMSRERLLAEVWGYHFDPSSNVVEVCVRRLRKKLGAGAPIQTIRRAGYRVPVA